MWSTAPSSEPGHSEIAQEPDHVSASLSFQSYPSTVSACTTRVFKKHNVNDIFRETRLVGAEASVGEDTSVERKGIHGACHRIANNVVFVGVFVVLIAVNICLITIESQILANRVLDKGYAAGFNISTARTVDYVFTALFVTEVTIRVLGSAEAAWKDSWLTLDVALVFMACLDAALFPLTSPAVETLSSPKVFRVLRALRAVRVVRLIRFVRPLRVLTEALGEALKAVFWIVLLFICWAYCYSILLCIMWAPEHPKIRGPHLLFPSVAHGMLVLMQVTLRGTDWGPELVHLALWPDSSEAPSVVGGGLAMLAFVIVTMIFNINVARGIFVSTFFHAAKRDQAIIDSVMLSEENKALNTLKGIFIAADTNRDQKLSWNEFNDHIRQNVKVWKKLNVSVLQAQGVFRRLPYDAQHRVDLDEFLIGLIKVNLSGRHSSDLLTMEYQQQKLLRGLRELAEVFNAGAHSVKQALFEVEHRLRSVAACATSISQEVCEMSVPEDRFLNELKTEPGDFRLLSSLQESHAFQTRLRKLEEALKQMTSVPDSKATLALNCVYPHASLLERLPTQMLTFEDVCPPSLTSTMGDCVRDDVVPFLQKWFSDRALARKAARSAGERPQESSFPTDAKGWPSPSRPKTDQAATSSRGIFTSGSLVPDDAPIVSLDVPIVHLTAA